MIQSFVCDFCSTDSPTWVFPSDSFTQSNTNDALQEFDLIGDWISCDTCYHFIVSNSRVSLAHHCLSYIADFDEFDDEQYISIFTRVRQLHDEFFISINAAPILLNNYGKT